MSGVTFGRTVVQVLNNDSATYRLLTQAAGLLDGTDAGRGGMNDLLSITVI